MKTIKLYLLILILGIFTAFFLVDAPLERGNNLFNSTLYAAYLKAWGRSESLNRRQDHEHFIRNLRKSGSDQEVRTLFLAKDLNPAWKSYLNEVVAIREGSLIDLHTQLKKGNRFNSIQHKPSFEDQMLLANLPSWVATVNGTEVIRIGQPALLGKWFTKTAVSPEFQQFVKSQPSHLYVNLMKRSGTEGTLSHSIEELENEIPQLIVVTLDKNSSFYDQDEKVSQPKESFKNDFFAHLQSSHYYWSSKIDRRALAKILQDVDQRYFNYQDILSAEERRDYIELYYVALLNWLQVEYQPTTMNITCRQGIDRGPSLMTLWLYKKGILNREEAIVQLFVPPLLFHNRPPHRERIKRYETSSAR